MCEHRKLPVANRLMPALFGSLVASSVVAAPPARTTDAPSRGNSAANMDERVSPRQDFYRHAAGRWFHRAEITASELAISGVTEISINAAALSICRDPRQRVVIG